MNKIIRVAHSPDADDIFMYHAIKLGWVETGHLHFVSTALDIETLNLEALRGTFDVTAISFASYPHIKDEYALLRTAVSFGYGYGPKLIKRKDRNLKRRFRLALSGKYTTNAMLARIYYPDAKPVYMNFMDIEQAVLDGSVDAGVLIHESILNFDERLEVEKELWDVWLELSQDELPLPLGGMAIRRSIPLTTAINIEHILIEGVDTANRRKEELCRALETNNLVRIGDNLLQRYLDMYASHASITLDDQQLRALDKLYDIGFRFGLWECPIKTASYLIPDNYTRLRSQ